MKKILLFGKLNDITKNVNEHLSQYFQIQLCSENPEVAKGLMKVYAPDMVIISQVGLNEVHSEFFNDLYNNYTEIPVITIGTMQEQLTFRAYYEHTQFQHLLRPVDNSFIMRSVCRTLGLNMEELIAEHEQKQDKRKHIVMVDDNVSSLRQMKKMLQETYKVSMAASATQAMTIMGRSKPDLVILDYDMPICDGKRMLQMIRADEKLKDVPVIFLTGISDKAHIMRVLDLKPAGYFLKPPVYEQILGTIEQLIGI